MQTITGTLTVAAAQSSGRPNYQWVMTSFGAKSYAGQWLGFSLQIRNVGTAAGAPALSGSQLTGPAGYRGVMTIVSSVVIPAAGVEYVALQATTPFYKNQSGTFDVQLVLPSGSTATGSGDVLLSAATTTSTSSSGTSGSTSSSGGSAPVISGGTGSTLCEQAQSYLQHLEANASALIASYIADGMSAATANALYQQTLSQQQQYIAQVCG